MSTLTRNARNSFAEAATKNIKTSLYGLHYEDCSATLMYRLMIIKALEMNEGNSYYSYKQIQTLTEKLHSICNCN
jgi:hypothetical protein